MANKFLVTIAAVGVTAVSLLAGSPAFAQSYSAPSQDEQIHGRIQSFDGAYDLQILDDRGYTDNVVMHQGTVINPTGLTLAPGMVVSINGYGNGSVFEANQIDTPYEMYGETPYYDSHPWSYYGGGVSLGFFFGNSGWWHGDYWGRPAYYNRGVYVYNRPPVYNNYNYNNYNNYNYNHNAPNQPYYRNPPNNQPYNQPNNGPVYRQLQRDEIRPGYQQPVTGSQRPTYVPPVRSVNPPESRPQYNGSPMQQYGGSVRPISPITQRSYPGGGAPQSAPVQRYSAPAAPMQRSAPVERSAPAPREAPVRSLPGR